MKKIAIFTGAGISQESGIETFRDSEKGLWYNYNVDEVATLSGWKNDRELVLEFHNMLRKKLYDIEPNDAHKAIADLEDVAKVTVVTQNVDDLHERGGSTDIIHIHGELLKCNSSVDPNIKYDCRGSVNIGDKCEKGSQLKPNTVLFGEYPYRIDEAFDTMMNADYLIVVGTSFTIGYTVTMMDMMVGKDTKIFYVDPFPTKLEAFKDINIEVIEKTAVEGVREVTKRITAEIKEAELYTD